MSRQVLYPMLIWTIWVVVWPLAIVALGFFLVVTAAEDVLLFDNQDLWWLAAAGPVAGLFFLYGLLRRRRAVERFASAQLAPLLAQGVSPGRQSLRAGLFVTAIALVAAAVVGPRWGVYLEKQKVYGVDIVVALDVSRSMLARDVDPNRLERAKRDIRLQLIDRAVFRHANRLALLTFAGSTSLKLPLTTDHLSFRSKLEAVTIGSAPRGGTAIAAAIRAASDLFVRSPDRSTKIIVVFTDGEDHEGAPVEAARVALAEQGIRTFTVGVGDPTLPVGAQIPTDAGTPLLHDGQIVFSKLDVVGLREIAEAGNGRFAPLNRFHRLVNVMGSSQKSLLTTEERIRHRPRYQWFLLAALILLGLETMISGRRPGETTRPQRVWQEEPVG